MSLSWVSRQRQAQRTSFPTSTWPGGLRNPSCPRPRGLSPAAEVRHSPQASRGQGRRRGDLIHGSRCFSGPCGSSKTQVLQLPVRGGPCAVGDGGHGRRQHRGPWEGCSWALLQEEKGPSCLGRACRGCQGLRLPEPLECPRAFQSQGPQPGPGSVGPPSPLTAKQGAQEGEEALGPEPQADRNGTRERSGREPLDTPRHGG